MGNLWRWSWTSGVPPALPPLSIMNSTVTAVESFRFLDTTISQDLKWDNHIESVVKKSQQRLYFLRQLRKFNLPQDLLIQFYSAIIDCWANHWYNPSHSPRTVLIQSEQKVCQNHSGPSHPAHSLFELLPSGRRYRALSTRTTRHRNSFFPQAIHLMNTRH